MKIGVKVLPRSEVLDSQGRAVQENLSGSGFVVSDCRVGKYIVLDVEAKNMSEAKNKVQEMAEYILYNPLIESYEIEEL